MSRVPPIEREKLTPEQRRIHDEIAAKRSSASGPFALWLRLPAVADGANRLGNALRSDGKIERRLLELAILVAARHASAQYPWSVHAPQAVAAGIAPEVVEAIRLRRVPSFTREDERLVYDLATELAQTQRLSQPSYDRALAHFGLELLLEFVTAVGFYTMITLVVNTFDVDAKDGQRPLD